MKTAQPKARQPTPIAYTDMKERVRSESLGAPFISHRMKKRPNL